MTQYYPYARIKNLIEIGDSSMEVVFARLSSNKRNVLSAVYWWMINASVNHTHAHLATLVRATNLNAMISLTTKDLQC